MKDGEPTVLAGKTAFRCARAGAAAGLIVTAGLLTLPLDAAIDRRDAGSAGALPVIDRNFAGMVAVDNDDTLEAAEAQRFVVAQAAPGEPAPTEQDAGNSAQTSWPEKELGLMDRVQDWLARANREFQTVIIRRLSVAPSGGGDDDIAKKLEQVKEEDAEAARQRAEDAIQAAQAKQADEAKRRKEAADTAKLADDMRKERERIEAETKRIEEQQRLADEKRKADEQKRLEEARRAVEAQQAAQKAAEEKKAAQEAAADKEAAAAKEERERAEKAAKAQRLREEEQHQRDLADAAEKAAETAKRVAAEQEAAKIAAAKAAEEKSKQEAAAREAAQKQRLAEEEAAKAAAAKAAEEKVQQDAATKEAAEKQRVAQEEAAKEAAVKAAQEKAQQDAAEKEAADRQRAAAEEAAKTAAAHAAEEQAKAATGSPPANITAEATAPIHEARIVREAHNRAARGPVVKPWVRRARQGRCRYAGRKILLPGHYVVARGDTLWRIALRHYRSGLYFMRIYRANRDIIRHPNLIYPCERIYLPRKRG